MNNSKDILYSFRSGLQKRMTNLIWSARFFTIISLIATIIGIPYLINYSMPSEPLAIYYTLSAYTGHLALFCFALWIILVIPLILIFPVRKIILVISVVSSSFLLALLLLDTLVYAANRFHIGLLTLTILGWKTWGFGIFYFTILLVFTSLTARIIPYKYSYKSVMKRVIFIALLEILFVLSTHLIHIYADAVYYVPVTKFTTVLPLFYPATARRWLEQRGYIQADENRGKNAIKRMTANVGNMHYPLRPLNYDSRNNYMNVVFIVVDALRASTVTEEMMPNVRTIGLTGSVFTNHFSGGNSTRMGLFSLFYGLPSTYWQTAEGSRIPPVMMDRFQDLGYNIGVFSTTQLNRPASLDRTVFARIENLRVVSNLQNRPPYAQDSVIACDWSDWLSRQDGKKPFFSFIFFDSPCGKSYPPGYDSIADYFSRHYDNPSFGKYLAAVHYTDSLILKIYQNLSSRNFLDKTVVIITADHGEEFDDNNLGFNGHGSSYSVYQLKVPLIVLWPGKNSRIVEKRTSHNDIPASVMGDILGCVNNASDYCSGYNLFSESQWEWLIAGSYYNYAVLEKDRITISYPGGYFEQRDNGYRVVSGRDLNKDILTSALNEIKRFYKK